MSWKIFLPWNCLYNDQQSLDDHDKFPTLYEELGTEWFIRLS